MSTGLPLRNAQPRTAHFFSASLLLFTVIRVFMSFSHDKVGNGSACYKHALVAMAKHHRRACRRNK
jgi:hypothetical protein